MDLNDIENFPLRMSDVENHALSVASNAAHLRDLIGNITDNKEEIAKIKFNMRIDITQMIEELVILRSQID